LTEGSFHGNIRVVPGYYDAQDIGITSLQPQALSWSAFVMELLRSRSPVGPR
jgi:hypothetical protein